ncbi:MAG: hypothetical protein MUO26_07745 [Methanotrichaceae archaeon]|nr:hypothetical protein [Methanotrichaceae archaeon]
MALKRVEMDDLERGTVLTSDASIKRVTSITGKAEIVNYWSSPLKERGWFFT